MLDSLVARAVICSVAVSAALMACGHEEPLPWKPYVAAPDPAAAAASPGFDIGVEAATPSGDLSIPEGRVGRIYVALKTAPTQPLMTTLTLPPGVATVSPATLTFDASNFNTPQTVTVSAPIDDNASSERADLRVTAESLPDALVHVETVDKDVQALIVSPNVLTVTEGKTDTLTVRPAFAPTDAALTVTVTSTQPGKATASPKTLTFTKSDYTVPQTVTVTGVPDADTATESVDFTLSAPGAPDTALAVTVVDSDLLNLSFSSSSVALTEGKPGKPLGISLTKQPSVDVVVTLTSSDVGAATVTPTTLTFTPANWATPQTITIAPVNDGDTANEAVTVTASAAGLAPQDISVAVTDDDVQRIVLTPTALSVNEGATATFTVALGADPVATTTVALTSSNPSAASLSVGSLTFTSADFAVPQTVTVTGVADANTVNETVTLTASSAGLTTQAVTLTTIDKDRQAIVVAPGAATVTETGTASLAVSLLFNPLGNTVVTVASSDTTAMTVSPATLTFTAANYATPQTVILTGVTSAGTANRAANAALAAPGVATTTVPVTVVDVAAQGLSITPTALTLTEGGATGSAGIKLTQAPAANVTVTLTSQSTGTATVAPATLTFTPANWATPQSVTVTPVHDANAATDVTAIVVASAGLTSQSISVTVNDVDAQAVVLSGGAVTVTEGLTATFTARLAFAPATSATVTVSSSNTLAVTAAPSTLTFTAANYATPQTITLTGVADANTAAETVTVTLTSSGVPNATVTATTVDTTAASCDPPAALPTPASGNHNAGVSCIQSGCHNVARASVTKAMTIGGTLYGAVTGGSGVSQATIHVVDANGVDVKISTATNGNFWSTQAVAFPVTVRASKCPNTDQKMSSQVTAGNGSCNACHGSGNRIHLP